jgi:hypothetical protein
MLYSGKPCLIRLKEPRDGVSLPCYSDSFVKSNKKIIYEHAEGPGGFEMDHVPEKT